LAMAVVVVTDDDPALSSFRESAQKRDAIG
jgi:hypothetical protein